MLRAGAIVGTAPLAAGALRLRGCGIEHPFGLIYAQMPGVAVDQVAAGARRMRLEATWSQQDLYAFGAQGLDATAERGTAR